MAPLAILHSSTTRRSDWSESTVAEESERHSINRAASLLFALYCGFVVVMEYSSKKKGLVVLFMFSCLLLSRVASAAPLSRSVSLMNQRLPDPAVVDVPLQGGEERNLGEVAARIVIEVNDYPGSGANNRHEPRSPGRA